MGDATETSRDDGAADSSHIGLDPVQLVFRMPTPSGTTMEACVAFAANSLVEILQTNATGPGKAFSDRNAAGTIVSFVGAGAAASLAVSVAMNRLFDMALADLLDAFGDEDMKTAKDALEESLHETTSRGVTWHRHTANDKLRDAHRKFTSSIAKRRAKLGNRLLGYGDAQVRAAHAKAAIAAALIASICDAEGLDSVGKWAQEAKKQFSDYEKMVTEKYREVADGLADAQREYDVTRRMGFIGDYPNEFALRNTQISIAQIELETAQAAAAAMSDLASSRRYFYSFLRRLSDRQGGT